MSELPEISDSEREFSELIVEHVYTPNNVLYAGFGRPCPRCKSFFSCSHDFDLHQKVCRDRQWRKSDFDEWEICPSELEPELKHACQVSGEVHSGIYRHRLSNNGKFLKRKRL